MRATIILLAKFCFVHGVYFTIRDVKTIFPFNERNLPSANNLLMAMHATDFNIGKPQYAWVENNIYLRLSPNGCIHFNEDLLGRNINGRDNISITALASVDDGLTQDLTSLEIVVVPMKSLDCDLIVEDLCFWSSVSYSIYENSKSTVLGSLASPLLLEICHGYKVNYKLGTGFNEFKVVPPTNEDKSWYLHSSKPLDREAYSDRPSLMLTCIVSNPNGAVFEREKTLRVEVLDVDDNLPVPQEKEFHLSMPKNIIHKGHLVEHQDLIFQDADSLEVNNYTTRVLLDYYKMLRPICRNIAIDSLVPVRTIIHCKLEFTKDMHFGNLTYPVILEMNDTNFKGENRLVKVPIHLYFNNGTDIRPAAMTLQFSRPLVLYPLREIRIFRTAAPFARVADPTPALVKEAKNFGIQSSFPNSGIFNITASGGIIYVQDFVALRRSKEFISLNITWTRNNILEFDEIRIRVVEEQMRTCENMNVWKFCAKFDNYDSCRSRTACAVGTGGANSVLNRKGPHRCEWRGDINPTLSLTTVYSTCTPDIKTCPDGVCDSLEKLNNSLCPQDCTDNVLFPTMRNLMTGRGIDHAAGVVVCNDLGGCYTTIPQSKKKNKSHASTQTSITTHVPNKQSNLTFPNNVTSSKILGIEFSKCGTPCMLGIIGGALFLVAAVSLIVICWRLDRVQKAVREKFSQRNQESTAPLSEYTRNDADPSMPIHFSMTTSLINSNPINFTRKYEADPKWEFPRSKIEIEQTLGEGEFGRVLRAQATNIGGQTGRITVAVKTLKEDARDSELNDLLSEYQLLKEVSHPNVIKLLGVCTTAGGPIYLIIEYAEYGSLRNYLRKSRNIKSGIGMADEVQDAHYDEPRVSQITPKEILSFAWQICNGMGYLSDVKLVHRDLAARNVLLANEKTCKISDFGLTRDIYEDNAYFKRSKGRVPVKWMAPESLSDHIYTSQSDVWSFGVLLWELVTLGASPYPGIAVQNLFHLLKQGYRMERPNNCSTSLYQIMRDCWDIFPDQRPTFHGLSSVFEKILEDGVEYLDLSNNLIQNRSYFCSPFEELQDDEVQEKADNNPLNYLSRSQSYEKCGETEKFLPSMPEILSTIKMPDYENNMQAQGYETPVKVPKIVKTPSNEHPQYYTDMAGQTSK